MDPDADAVPAILIIDLQDANKKLIFKNFSAYYFLKVHVPRKVALFSSTVNPWESYGS
jgi:hypothetical protein